jgi:hypothetical protein
MSCHVSPARTPMMVQRLQKNRGGLYIRQLANLLNIKGYCWPNSQHLSLCLWCATCVCSGSYLLLHTCSTSKNWKTIRSKNTQRRTSTDRVPGQPNLSGMEGLSECCSMVCGQDLSTLFSCLQEHSEVQCGKHRRQSNRFGPRESEATKEFRTEKGKRLSRHEEILGDKNHHNRKMISFDNA